MAAPPSSGGDPITTKRQLVEWLEAGVKPKVDWRVGTEHEKFVFDLESKLRAPYEGERVLELFSITYLTVLAGVKLRRVETQ